MPFIHHNIDISDILVYGLFAYIFYLLIFPSNPKG